MADYEKRTGPKVDPKVYRDEVRASLARKATAAMLREQKQREDLTAPRSLARGYKPE